LFLRGLPFKEPERVVHMYSNARERNLLELAISIPRFQHYRDGQTIFDGFGGENILPFTLTGLGEPVQLFGGKVTSNYFDVLGVRPIRGRNFLPEEEETADVAMVTENFWQKRMGGDPNVVGRSITLDGVPHTIVGVLPNLPFSWIGPNAEIWTTKPFLVPGLSHERVMRGSGFLRVIGRLKPGMTIEQARAALPSLEQSYRAQYPDKIDSSSVMTLKTLPEDVTGNLRPAFATLLAAVAFVLLIACSNVANLLLVRFSGRRREIALRMAIGASRGSVVRLFVFESLLVSVFAGIAGAFLAWHIVPFVPKMAASFVRLNRQNIGYHCENVWIGFVTLPQAQYPDLNTRQHFAQQTLSALRAVPGLESATISADIPLLAGAGGNALYARPDGEILPIDKRAAAASHDIAPDYFKTWGIPILAGRDFDEHDTAGQPNVLLISKAGAKKIFGSENPIGKTLLYSSSSIPAEIIGVVGDVRSRKVAEPDEVELY